MSLTALVEPPMFGLILREDFDRLHGDPMIGRRVMPRLLKCCESAPVADNRVLAKRRLGPTRYVPSNYRGLVTVGRVRAIEGGTFQTLPVPAARPNMVDVGVVVVPLQSLDR